MIYLDNAATSYPKPPCVIEKINFCLRKCGGNPGRSSHRLSMLAAEEIYRTREAIADLIHIDTPEQIVFTMNATEALNLAIKSFVAPGDHILISDAEHNSVLRPLAKLKESLGIQYSEINGNDPSSSLESNFRENTRGIVCSIASNVTGRQIPLPLLTDFAIKRGLFLIIDASQAIGHTDIDLSKYPCDALCAPGHKALFGIQGCGFAYFRDRRRRQTLIEGGSGSNSMDLCMPELLPEGYEAGTPPTPAIVGLGEGVRFVKEIGIEEIEHRLEMLTDNLYEMLSGIKGVKIYGRGLGILSFNYMDIPSSVISAKLDRMGICVRGGLHCAPSVHKRLGTVDQGAVRVSFSYFNDLHDPMRFYKAIRQIEKEK